jgi:hypothetical protein
VTSVHDLETFLGRGRIDLPAASIARTEFLLLVVGSHLERDLQELLLVVGEELFRGLGLDDG